MRTSLSSSLLALLCLAACTPAQQDTAPHAACAPASAAASAPPAATSKLRHIPDENNGCHESRGLAPR